MSHRLIARLDIKGPNLIKPVQLEGLRVIGDPEPRLARYYAEGADEFLFIDAVASLYGRNNLSSLLEYSVRNIFVPVTAGGGVRSVSDVEQMLRSGADKVAINTQAVRTPELISDIARRFGSQCMVLSVQAKRRVGGGPGWECYIDGGREHTGLDVVDWVRRGADLGAGEILLTSVDREGTRKGFDLELVSAVSEAVNVPVIASGGLGRFEHAGEAVRAGASAVAVADMIHYDRATLNEIKAANHPMFSVRAAA
ncbi:imidazole glycerol phosphate synthase subunit HisF [Phenylobacterium terrae]|uniref:Imidazole glycerol phosphate synthase subunit HisF n=1 Tax=Phenylobacterium terrae TaxID=2665495 RepID=A0ABW4N3C6_9CAUL